MVHRSFKAVNGIHHLQKDRVEQRVRLLGSLPAMSAIDPLRSAKRT
jgi:hypothetical protein